MEIGFGYSFPAIRGVQARKEYYVSMCPLSMIAKIFLFDEKEINPELRAQRVLAKNRVPEIANYILTNRENYTFSALTASIDGNVLFTPIPGSDNMGSLKVDMNAKIIINDGQHRRAAIEAALKECPYYVDMIRANMKPGMPTALCTHHVPHVRLNGHEPGHYSFYTGMQDLVHNLPFNPLYNNYLICGHTHRRVIGEVVPGFMGVNVGSDYDDLKTFTLEV